MGDEGGTEIARRGDAVLLGPDSGSETIWSNKLLIAGENTLKYEILTL